MSGPRASACGDRADVAACLRRETADREPILLKFFALNSYKRAVWIIIKTKYRIPQILLTVTNCTLLREVYERNMWVLNISRHHEDDVGQCLSTKFRNA